LKTGERVRITYDRRTVTGQVLLGSDNGKSLMLEFEAILGGFVGTMPVLLDEQGTYRDLLFGREVKLEFLP
jgi:hypothetical protein